MKTLPLISIITPSLNQVAFIREAIESVEAQNYRHFEHIVLDGLSDDGTVELLGSLSLNNKHRSLRWISESDGGQSDALNKGFRRAKGDIVGWLNSDDRYRNGCFEKVVQAFKNYPEIDVFYGDYSFIDDRGGLLQTRREIEFSPFVLRYHRVLYIATTATFFRRRIFEEGNYLSEGLHYAMDVDFFLRLDGQGYKFKHLPEMLADYRLQPNSKTCSAPFMQRMEHNQVVLSSTPVLKNISSVVLKRALLLFLRTLAALRRYSEKLLRGYYWTQFTTKVIE